ncbi:class II aldolase/adducin family protein [Lacticaseibacillus yichunensis]|uniref:Class II aldolase/adducin family protein n=1 Tax=Lacticaseibacillus yichunensis TaxID=2486015 RepID=A0ABW4CKS8_9LACO|nr:class II aldolase/adducin family protein [Lacticaseibacillus yichunensis]
MLMMFEAQRQDLAETVRLMFDRKDTNIAGGNVSMKVFDETGKAYILITPSFMSETFYARLSPAQILVVDMATGEKVDGVGTVTREINMHEGAYRANPGIRTVFHAHAPESMFWATSGLEMPNVTEGTRELGRIRTLPYAPATSMALAKTVSDALAELGDRAMENVFLLNSHGVVITATDLHIAVRVLETLEWNAKIAYQQTVFIHLGLLKGYQSCGADYQPVEDEEHPAISLPNQPVVDHPAPLPKVNRVTFGG